MEPLGLGALINVAVLIVLLGSMWKLSRDIKSAGDRIRSEVRQDTREVREDMGKFRTEVREDMGKLSGRIDVLTQQVSTLAERVARMEGVLQMPEVVIVQKPDERAEHAPRTRRVEIGTEQAEPAGVDA